jgi:hypothetical protein
MFTNLPAETEIQNSLFRAYVKDCRTVRMLEFRSNFEYLRFFFFAKPSYVLYEEPLAIGKSFLFD